MPLDQAIYHAATGTILGVMGPYIAKFNATTGVREAIQKITGPAEGPCKLCYHAATGMVYVGIWNSQIGRYDIVTADTVRDLYPVNPTTLAIGAKLGTYEYVVNSDYTPLFYQGFHWLLSVGSLIWFTWYGRVALGRIDPTNVAAFIGNEFATLRDIGSHMLLLMWEQIASDGVGIYFSQSQLNRFGSYVPIASTTCAVTDAVTILVGDRGIVMPYSTEYCGSSSSVYVVCGDGWLVHADLAGAGSYTTHNLDTLNAGCTAYRLRYCDTVAHPYFGKLLIPSQGNDTVIVWDPASDTGIAKTGFDGPIDVVFTPTKAFAVQSGLVSLKEIT